MYTFTSSTLDRCKPIFDEYLSTLSAVNDDFWEEHVFGSQVYRIEYSGETIGMFGIYRKENLTFFYMPLPYLRHAQPAFTAILERLAPRYAFVPTSDELFLSLCMDNHKTVEKQAYFFRHSEASVRPPEWGYELLRLAEPSDEADILDNEGVADNIRLGKYYVMRKDGVFLGQGFLNRNQLTPNTASIGMSVHPDYRQKGVGRSIMLHLTRICHEKGLAPYCGCWYYNHNSKRTLESAGFVTKTRLLKVWFVDPKDAAEPQSSG